MGTVSYLIYIYLPIFLVPVVFIKISGFSRFAPSLERAGRQAGSHLNAYIETSRGVLAPPAGGQNFLGKGPLRGRKYLSKKRAKNEKRRKKGDSHGAVSLPRAPT